MAEKWARWCVPELEIMNAYYSDMPRDELLKLLPGRTWKAITGAAGRFGFVRDSNTPKSEAEEAAMRVRLNIARAARTAPPFAGKHHSAEAKLAISVANLHARSHCIAYIAVRNGIAEKEVKKILENKEKRKRQK